MDAFRRDLASGVAVIGTEAGCGKTVFTTGVAAALREQGFPTRAIKPFVIGTRQSAEAELSFMSSISRTPLNYQTALIEKPSSVPEAYWQNAVMLAASRQYLTFVELPGAASTPINYVESHIGTVSPSWKDAADFAIELNLPVILVGKHNHELFEKVTLAINYLKSRGARLVGVATVETAEYQKPQEFKLTRADLELGLNSRFQTHYLGLINYSPSISVPRVNQGNLIKMTSQGIDMLLILRALNAPVSA